MLLTVPDENTPPVVAYMSRGLLDDGPGRRFVQPRTAPNLPVQPAASSCRFLRASSDHPDSAMSQNTGNGTEPTRVNALRCL
jgi:hypothetical protein